MMDSNPLVVRIMENQRKIQSTYTIRRNKILDPVETVWTTIMIHAMQRMVLRCFQMEYYYNLLKQIKDSAEVRKLVFRAISEYGDAKLRNIAICSLHC